MENVLTNIGNSQRDEWDQKISTVLWVYHMPFKKLIGHTPFLLVYGQEAMMLMEYIIQSLRIVSIAIMTYVDVVEEILLQLVQFEENRFVVGYHQNVEK